MHDTPPRESEEPKDTYADFLTRAVSLEATALIDDLTKQTSAWERERKRGDNQTAPKRGPYQRGEKTLANLRDGLGRFVGHLLRATADPDRTGKVFRSLKKDIRWSCLV
jgi:hypothetical protein